MDKECAGSVELENDLGPVRLQPRQYCVAMLSCIFSNEDRKVHRLSKRWMTVEETGGCKQRIINRSEVKANENIVSPQNAPALSPLVKSHGVLSPDLIPVAIS